MGIPSRLVGSGSCVFAAGLGPGGGAAGSASWAEAIPAAASQRMKKRSASAAGIARFRQGTNLPLPFVPLHYVLKWSRVIRNIPVI